MTDVPGACPIDAHGNQILQVIPSNYRDGRWDTASIFKMQYQKNIGSNAYVRLFGYTFYSNTNRATANGWGNNVTLGVTNYQYVVDSHTGGLELQFADQISNQHLLQGMVSYLTSNTLRYANRNYDNTGSQQVSNFTDGSECFATYTSPTVSRWRSGAVQQVRLAGALQQPVRRLRRPRSLHRRRAERHFARV